MSEESISSQIQKLGHKILEIRERALFNVVAKFENGILFDNDIARIRELLIKLFQWFIFEPCTKEEIVFSLLKRILKSESGIILLNHYGEDALKMELGQLRSYLDPQYYSYLDELYKLMEDKKDLKVPPFETDVPLSYRTTTSDSINNFTFPTVYTTATAIEGSVRKESSVEEQVGIQNSSQKLNLNDDASSTASNTNKKKPRAIQNFYLKWQPLIESDRHVLQSVENSLKNPPESSALLSSCEFFSNILLHDFPAEIFLQRPTIVLEFYNLMTCGSSRLGNAVLSALSNLTKLLRTRIYHCNDTSLQNFKANLLHVYDSICNTPQLSVRNSEYEIPYNMSENCEKIEDILEFQRNQLSLPLYCFTTTTKVFGYLCVKQEDFGDNRLIINKVGINLCLILLEDLFYLLTVCFENEIWDLEQNEASLTILKEFNEMLIQYGEALEHFRVKFIISETNSVYRIVYLHLIHNTAMLLKHLVPLSKANIILPNNFKNALSNSVLDVMLRKLYPDVHNIVLEYVKSFCHNGEIEHLRKYENVIKICKGMSATVQFLKQQNFLNISEGLKLAKEALPSIEFHTNLEFLKIFIDMCSSKFYQVYDNCEMKEISEETILNLLSHNLMEIKKEMYRLCHHIVLTHIGPETNVNSNGSRIIFLLSSKILINVTAFGMTSEDLEIKRCAEDILLYILKCRIIVSETVWNKVIQALIPSLPAVACHSSKDSPLGKTVMTLIDPDTAVENCIPPIVMLKCNIQFLFAKEIYLREEAFSRICWLLTSQEKYRDLLPKFNAVYDAALANVCYLKILVDINKCRITEHFYQPTSLRQVMEVLNSENLEPVLRRSALNQVSLMMEDPLLHQIFLEMNGIPLVTEIMKSALNEQDYRDYPDSIIPIISVLKNVCLYHFNIREELSTNIEVFYLVLRGLFLFFTEERVKQDVATLLCLLIFKDFVLGTPSNGSFSLPILICDNIYLPFICNTHWKVSDYTKSNLKDSIISDQWCLSSIRIQWNLEIFGDFQELIKWNNVNCDNTQFDFTNALKLNNSDLKALKTSSIHFCITEYLNTIQNATSHHVAIESIDYLTMFVNLYKMTTYPHTNISDDNFLSHPWEQTFAKFLKCLPSCKDDMFLLRSIIKFLTILVPFYKLSETECWIIAVVKVNTQYLLDLLDADSTCQEDKITGQELLALITVCVCQEQHYLDYYSPDFIIIYKPWAHVIYIIADVLKFSDAQHFYNLADLDFLLLSLVHLTASLGWTKCKVANNPKEIMQQLISGLCELIRAFHCGKGSSASVSVMGLSITRHVLLILNNLVAELQNSKFKFWERYFFNDLGGISLKSFLALWTSRDVIVRAAALQLFSGLAASPRATVEILAEIKDDKSLILDLTFTVLLDNFEANIVREYAANLLSNLLSHMTPLTISKTLNSNTPSVLQKNYTKEILCLIEEYDFYSRLELILCNLLTLNTLESTWDTCSSQGSLKNTIDNTDISSSGNSENFGIITTPGLVKAVGVFLHNILNLVAEDVTNKLQECGLVKLLFRSLCNPSMSVSNTRELSLYCDILEMDIVICAVLIKLSTFSSACLGTILHTNDCLNVLISLLNYKNFHTNMPQLIYLRNKLWAEIFDLLTTLIENANVNEDGFHDRSIKVLTILCETIFDTKTEFFLETMCESISCIGSIRLQNSALIALTSLLKTESYRSLGKSDVDTIIFKTDSLQHILDSIKTPRSVVISDKVEGIKTNIPFEKHRQIKNKYNKHKINLLEEAYFDNIFPKLEQDVTYDSEVCFIENNKNDLMAGGKLCKILVYLYNISTLQNEDIFNKNKSNIISALASLLCVSGEAKKYALEKDFLNTLIKQLREKHIQLSLESVECLRRVADKKRISPLLKDVNNLIKLITNFMINNNAVKNEAAALSLADVVHKLWVWFLMYSTHLIDVLQLLNVYTTGCSLGCQSMSLTSATVGSEPRKVPSNISLLYAIITLITKEMEQVSKTHNLSVLELCFNIICNCCESQECRNLISKSNLFNGILRLHPGITKRQKPWDSLEFMWLEFLQSFTAYPEGQASITKASDVLELIISLAYSTKSQNKLLAILVLRNISFYQPNRSRLLSSGEFLNILHTKLNNGTSEEKNAVVTIIWALVANNQKAKIILKSAHLDTTLDDTIKHSQLLRYGISSLDEVDLNKMTIVLNLLRNSN